VADSGPSRQTRGAGGARAAGWRDVLIVAAVAVAVVLGAAILTSALPTDAQRFIFHTPLLIAVLIIGTGLVLWRIAARRPPDP
jgi:anti-sigma-K factor RskA